MASSKGWQEWPERKKISVWVGESHLFESNVIGTTSPNKRNLSQLTQLLKMEEKKRVSGYRPQRLI